MQSLLEEVREVSAKQPCGGRGAGRLVDQPVEAGGRRPLPKDNSDSRPLHGGVGRWGRFPRLSRGGVGGRMLPW